ncbi:MAG: DUF72 domain-containing protein [Myxococcota bacterium]
MIRNVHLGMPFWGFADWQGALYTQDSRASDFLTQYGRAFNSVEGNTTFYATPNERTVARWRAETPDDFRFCFKLPKTITHDAVLYDVRRETEGFLDCIAPLRERLGPVMVQLPPHFGAQDLPRLDAFLGELPDGFRYAVEFRDAELAQDGTPARLAEDILEEHGVGRVIMDTRALRAGSPDHPDVLAALHKKPNLPVREEALSEDPIVRIVFHPDESVNERWLDRWSRILAHWIRDGLRPFVFIHSPSNRESPQIARDLHARLGALEPVGELPPWPGEEGESASGQLALL